MHAEVTSPAFPAHVYQCGSPTWGMPIQILKSLADGSSLAEDRSGSEGPAQLYAGSASSGRASAQTLEACARTSAQTLGLQEQRTIPMRMTSPWCVTK